MTVRDIDLGEMSCGVGKANYDTTGTHEFDIAHHFAVTQDIVIVEPEREEVTKGGLIIADVGDAQKLRWGRVVNAGPGRHESGAFVANPYKRGYRVMFGRYQAAGEPIKVAGREYLLFRAGDLIGWDTRG